MAYNAFLQIDGLKGESTDSEHKDWIEVLSYSNLHPVQAPPLSTSASSRSGSHAKPSFSVTKLIDSTSPKLYQAVSTGKHIKKVTIELLRASGGSKVKYMTITMDQVIISNVTAGSKAQLTTTPSLLTETISFNYGSIEWEYT